MSEEQIKINTAYTEEQMRGLIVAYYQEFPENYSFPEEHPLYDQMRATLSDPFTWRLINEMIENRNFTNVDENLIKVLTRDPLTNNKEGIRTFLRICSVFCSIEDLLNSHYHTLSHTERGQLLRGAAIMQAALSAVESTLRQPEILAGIQEELRTLYTITYDTERAEYFRAWYYTETHAFRLLIADLLFQGNPPGLAALLRDDEHSPDRSYTEEHIQTILNAYHDEMGYELLTHVNHPVFVLIQRKAHQHLQIYILKAALHNAYTLAHAQAHPVTNDITKTYCQDINLFWALYRDDLPYTDEDLLYILGNFSSILQLSEQYKNTFNWDKIIHTIDRLLTRLEQSQDHPLQPAVLATLYEPFRHLTWDNLDANVNQLRLRLRHMLFPESAGPLQDLFNDPNKHFNSEDAVRTLLATYHEEWGGGLIQRALSSTMEQHIHSLTERLSPQGIAWLVRFCAEEIRELQPNIKAVEILDTWRRKNEIQVEQNLLLINALCKKTLPFSAEDIRILLNGLRFLHDPTWPLLHLKDELEPLLRQPGIMEHSHSELAVLLDLITEAINDPNQYYHYQAEIRHVYLIFKDIHLGYWQHFRYPLLPDRWGETIITELAVLPSAERDPWLKLLDHCAHTTGTTLAKTWLEKAQPLIAAVGTEHFIPTMRRWINVFSDKKDGYMGGKNADILRALIWLCTGYNDRGLAAALGNAAIEGYRKLAGAGPRSTKVGDAAVAVLASMSGKDAISQLERVRLNVKQPSYQKKIGNALDSVAEREHMSRTDLEELMVPTFDLQDGRVHIPLGTWSAELRAGGRKVEQRWLDAQGQSHTALPAAIKREHKDEIKTIKQQADDLEHMLGSLRSRLEQMFLHERHWLLEDWKERYLNHPLLSVLARKLIWQFKVGEQSWRGIWHDGQLVDAQNQPLELPVQSDVILWHPLMGNAEEALQWQVWLEEQHITQPFKQAHREIYPLTDAERETRYYSRRFAGHILRHHQFNTLARTRGWQFALHSWYSGITVDDPATLEISALGLQAQLTFSGSERYEEIPRYIVTNRVRFLHPHTGPLALEEIPAITFSEVMRDVDLFVSVTSAGTDLQDNDTPDQIETYWQAYNHDLHSPQVAERKQILARLLPRLAIGERCHLEDHFLYVQGDRHTYRIHLVSGNIFIEPGDTYLCIVPDARSREKQEERFYLPFEGDPLFSLILSKAFLLAEDSKITDPSILSQIQRA